MARPKGTVRLPDGTLAKASAAGSQNGTPAMATRASTSGSQRGTPSMSTRASTSVNNGKFDATGDKGPQKKRRKIDTRESSPGTTEPTNVKQEETFAVVIDDGSPAPVPAAQQPRKVPQAEQLRERAQRMAEREELEQLRKNIEELKNENKQLKGEVFFKDATIITQSGVIDQVQQALLCNVCYEPLKDPHSIVPCGHVACGKCLTTWFRSVTCLRTPLNPNTHVHHPDEAWRHRKKCCFTCRTVVEAKPVPQYMVKDLLAAVEPVAQHAIGGGGQAQARAAAAEPFDTDVWNDLFDEKVNESWYLDEFDNVRRCSGCHFEVDLSPECPRCGQVFSDYDGSEDGESVMHSGDESDDRSGLERRMLGYPWGQDPDYESDAGSMDGWLDDRPDGELEHYNSDHEGGFDPDMDDGEDWFDDPEGDVDDFGGAYGGGGGGGRVEDMFGRNYRRASVEPPMILPPRRHQHRVVDSESPVPSSAGGSQGQPGPYSPHYEPSDVSVGSTTPPHHAARWRLPISRASEEIYDEESEGSAIYSGSDSEEGQALDGLQSVGPQSPRPSYYQNLRQFQRQNRRRVVHVSSGDEDD